MLWITAEERPAKVRSTEMFAIKRIARRVASVVNEMNYAQRKSTELFVGLGENRR
jgi:hypothetical protein